MKKMLDSLSASPLASISVGASLLKSQALRSNPRGFSRSGGELQSDTGSRSRMDSTAQHYSRQHGKQTCTMRRPCCAVGNGGAASFSAPGPAGHLLSWSSAQPSNLLSNAHEAIWVTRRLNLGALAVRGAGDAAKRKTASTHHSTTQAAGESPAPTQYGHDHAQNQLPQSALRTPVHSHGDSEAVVRSTPPAAG